LNKAGVATLGNSAHIPIMDPDRRSALAIAILKSAQLLLILICAFTLGKYSVQFSGSGLEWTAVVLFGSCLTGLLYVLVRGFWKIHA
jgi:hypothetical protein